MAKLTKEKVQQIIDMYYRGDSQKVLAESFGVSDSTVSELLKRKFPVTGNVQPLLHIGSKGLPDLLEMVRPFIKWECFRYKVERS